MRIPIFKNIFAEEYLYELLISNSCPESVYLLAQRSHNRSKITLKKAVKIMSKYCSDEHGVRMKYRMGGMGNLGKKVNILAEIGKNTMATTN